MPGFLPGFWGTNLSPYLIAGILSTGISIQLFSGTHAHTHTREIVTVTRF